MIAVIVSILVLVAIYKIAYVPYRQVILKVGYNKYVAIGSYVVGLALALFLMSHYVNFIVFVIGMCFAMGLMMVGLVYGAKKLFKYFGSEKYDKDMDKLLEARRKRKERKREVKNHQYEELKKAMETEEFAWNRNKG